MTYGCIGEHLSHSFSKDIHNRLDSYEYILKEIPRGELASFMTQRDFKAINVTIPYKQDVIPFLDYIDDVARTIGAVNTIVNRDGKLYGYNTDFGGMTALINRIGLNLKDKKVLICGTGGTSRTAVAVAQSLGAKEVYRISRSENPDTLTYQQAYAEHKDCNIIINTTPCGMFPSNDTMPIDPTQFPQLEGVADAVYNPLSTRLVQTARGMGVPAECGLYMLVMQAVLAWEIFTDKTCPIDKAEQVYNDVLCSRRNIVLIGMPGSGKSTVGKLLADTLNRPFIDTDEKIVETTGKSIPEIFEQYEEKGFRQIETDTVKQVACLTGAVIATGGGVVTKKENIDALRSNGRIYYLDRPLEDIIPTADRPLGNSSEAIRQRFEERYPLYKQAADVTIKIDGDAQQIAQKIKEETL